MPLLKCLYETSKIHYIYKTPPSIYRIAIKLSQNGQFKLSYLFALTQSDPSIF